VLVHGTGASLHTWEGWVRELRTQRRVITFDLPGFGLTGPSANADYHGDTYARFVLTLMDRLQVPRFVIGGNSLGGEVAWRVASLAPQRVDRLLLVDAAGYPLAPESVPLGFRAARLPVLGWLGEHLLPRGVIASSLHDVYGDASHVSDALVERYFELTLREGNRRALSQRLHAMEQDLADPDQVVARLRGLRVPTLILWGGRDRLIPIESGRRFEADIAGSRLVLIDDLGHVPQEEDPQRSLAAVASFLGLRR
jgi:pimeloyl-ACP methyl ester carboxylesterase